MTDNLSVTIKKNAAWIKSSVAVVVSWSWFLMTKTNMVWCSSWLHYKEVCIVTTLSNTFY